MKRYYARILAYTALVLCWSAFYAEPLAAQTSGSGVESGYDGGFFIRTTDKKFSLTANGFIQARFTSNLAASNNFDLALGRFALSGNVFDPNIRYFFQYEGSTFGNTNFVTMLDWWLAYTVSPALTIRMGRMILPYSRQFYTHPGNLLFTDLSNADYAFNLQRTLGVEVSGSLGFAHYHLMLMNSVRALDGGPSQVNVSGDIGWLARVEVPILGGGYGYMESVPNFTGAPQLSIGAAIASNPVASRSGFQRTLAGDRTLNITADAGFRAGGLSVQGAYHLRNNTSGAVSWTDNGFYVQAGFYLVPQLELGARYSSVSFAFPSADAFRLRGTETEITAGLNYYLAAHGAKIQLDYSLISNNFTGAAASANRVRLQTQILF
ncbi:MAG: hypothetical protein EAZ92_15935 [Candidatus Kapaibacterium sp.]|nr:MAG: hypothetical protein EAZ92_15935 [Candidatus Kapabacteria bacterium]